MNPTTHDHGDAQVGYILKMFPRLSETFILHELLELQRQGIAPAVFSLMLDARSYVTARLSGFFQPLERPSE